MCLRRWGRKELIPFCMTRTLNDAYFPPTQLKIAQWLLAEANSQTTNVRILLLGSGLYQTSHICQWLASCCSLTRYKCNRERPFFVRKRVKTELHSTTSQTPLKSCMYTKTLLIKLIIEGAGFGYWVTPLTEIL